MKEENSEELFVEKKIKKVNLLLVTHRLFQWTTLNNESKNYFSNHLQEFKKRQDLVF